jgi:hypothetical protein
MPWVGFEPAVPAIERPQHGLWDPLLWRPWMIKGGPRRRNICRNNRTDCIVSTSHYRRRDSNFFVQSAKCAFAICCPTYLPYQKHALYSVNVRAKDDLDINFKDRVMILQPISNCNTIFSVRDGGKSRNHLQYSRTCFEDTWIADT